MAQTIRVQTGRAHTRRARARRSPRGRGLAGLVVALCLGAATLSACAESQDWPTAESVQQQDRRERADQAGDETEDEKAERKAEQRAKQKARQKARQKKAEQKAEQVAAGATATPADLDAYADAAEQGLEEMFGESFEKFYSAITVRPRYPSGIEFDYTYRATVDAAAVKPQLDLQVPTLRTQARTLVLPEMKSLGFAHPSVAFTYRNPDGSVVWTRTFS